MVILKNGSYASLVVTQYGHLGETRGFYGENDFHIHNYNTNEVIPMTSSEVMPYWLQLGDKFLMAGVSGICSLERIKYDRINGFIATIFYGGGYLETILPALEKEFIRFIE